MKIGFFTEKGKSLPTALTESGHRGSGYAKIGMTLLRYPDGTFELVTVSRDPLKGEEIARMQEWAKEVDPS
ncbi:hypothetical protein [Paraburkholderia tropica]|uniref:hypothetical protein n=1 Tax=Paraburkholderia tropica TaxID=92647 RepID=UPI002AAF549C|nr:hypothetical protein [Paraburkholderia tropica]